jgi:hypothetical protein
MEKRSGWSFRVGGWPNSEDKIAPPLTPAPRRGGRVFCLKEYRYPKVETPMASFALSNFEKTSNKLSSIEKRRDAVQRQIDVQREAYALIPKGVESNPTILYYMKERERVSTKQDIEISALEAKIKTTEAKKQAAIEAIIAKFDSEINVLEVKKNNLEATLKTEAERYTSEIQRITEKLEDPDPPTPAFRRLKADRAKIDIEEAAATEEYRVAHASYVQEVDKQTRRQQAEQQEILRQQSMAQALKEQEQLKLILQSQEREREASYERNKQRAEEAKNKAPVKAYVIKIHPNTPYTIKELQAMDKSDFDDEENELWSKKYTEAQYREGIKKWDTDSDTEIVQPKKKYIIKPKNLGAQSPAHTA